MAEGLRIGELAERIGAELVGDPERLITGAASLDAAGPGELAFLASRKYRPYLAKTHAGAVIVARDLKEVGAIPEGTALMWVDDAHVALAAALSHLYLAPPRSTGISPEAIVEDSVELGKNVAIEPFVVIAEGARLGNGVRIGAHSVVGARCTLGEDTELKEHVCLYPDTIVGARCTIHSGARLGVDGYGYIFQEGRHRKVLQVGRCVIEDDVEIGANTCIDRGSVGETRIGSGTKIDNLVHIAHNVRVGRDCLVVAQVGVAGSTTLGDNVALGGQVGVIGHITIGKGAQVAAQTGVARDIPAGETWFGSPARPLPEMMRAIAAMRKLPALLKRVRRLEEKAAADES